MEIIVHRVELMVVSLSDECYVARIRRYLSVNWCLFIPLATSPLSICLLRHDARLPPSIWVCCTPKATGWIHLWGVNGVAKLSRMNGSTVRRVSCYVSVWALSCCGDSICPFSLWLSADGCTCGRCFLSCSLCTYESVSFGRWIAVRPAFFFFGSFCSGSLENAIEACFYG